MKDGAVESGQRVASEVLDSISSGESKTHELDINPIVMSESERIADDAVVQSCDNTST